MKRFRPITVLISIILMAACTDYATFVTSTDIGINADANTQNLSIGYVRTELFVGPAYPEQGEALQAVGFLASNLSAFQPHIKQLYATGDAAALVTQSSMTPNPSQAQEQYYGQRRPLVFGTGSNVGLKVGFAGGTAPFPSSIRFGYNREELSIIPLRRDEPTSTSKDKYAPVLAAIDMDLAASTLPGTTLALTQFFATGAAARNLATHPDIRAYFDAQATTAVRQAAVEEAVATVLSKRQTDYDVIVGYFAKFPVSEFANARDRLLDTAGIAGDPLQGPRLKAKMTSDEFLKYIKEDPGLIGRLAPFAVKLTAQK